MVNTSADAALKRKLEKLNLTVCQASRGAASKPALFLLLCLTDHSQHIRALFPPKRLGISTAMICAIWAFIGLAYPLYNAFLPFIQATRGFEFGDCSTYITYRNSLIIAVLGVPGALLGGFLVELKRFGRKGTLAVSTALTGVFLYASTTALDSNTLLGWNCGFSFATNVMVRKPCSTILAPSATDPSYNRSTPRSTHTPQRSSLRKIGVQAMRSQRQVTGSSELWLPLLPCSQISRLPRRCTLAEPCSSLQGCLPWYYPSSHRARLACDGLYGLFWARYTGS